jgi:hypothetical protein
MRLFKKYENVTPTEFRKAYYRTYINTKYYNKGRGLSLPRPFRLFWEKIQKEATGAVGPSPQATLVVTPSEPAGFSE